MVSGLTGEGLTRLLDLIDQVVPFDVIETVQFRIPLRDGAAIALLHRCGRVRAEDYDGNLCVMEVDAPNRCAGGCAATSSGIPLKLWKILCTSEFGTSQSTAIFRLSHGFEPQRSNPAKRFCGNDLAFDSLNCKRREQIGLVNFPFLVISTVGGDR